ncbi:MAG: hypothetical protein BRD23_01720 [Halobacteriales archaeon SW_9_67_25]|nr:MAG: hypothetical protein BRD23_01720 [Halobacteriales archaeon SW_9_67_25]
MIASLVLPGRPVVHSQLFEIVVVLDLFGPFAGLLTTLADGYGTRSLAWECCPGVEQLVAPDLETLEEWIPVEVPDTPGGVPAEGTRMAVGLYFLLRRPHGIDLTVVESRRLPHSETKTIA